MIKQIKEGTISRIADAAYAVRFLRLLVQPWEKTKAYEFGFIDKKGKRIKTARGQPVKVPKTSEEHSAYTIFHRLVYNIKRLIPGGKFGSYISALFLLKEKYKMSDEKLIEMLEKALDEPLEISEKTQWFMEGTNKDLLGKGVYMLINEIASPETGHIIANARTKVKVDNHMYPYSTFCGVNIYEVIHIPTNQKIYITNQDIQR